MRDISNRVLAILPAVAAATVAVEVSVMDLHHKWVSHILVPSIWGVVFGVAAYAASIWILRPNN